MVVAANFAFAQIRPKKEKEVPSPHYSPQPIIPKEVIMEELDKELYTEEDEKRMDVIGQNGNDGLHYDEPEEKESVSPKPINPTKEDLNKLQDYLDNLNPPTMERLTDTTQTLVVKKEDSKEEDKPKNASQTIWDNVENNRVKNANRVLRYRKRKE